MILSPQHIIDLTPNWTGDRGNDGRPRVRDEDLATLVNATAEHAWSVLDKAGYPQQYAGGWVQSWPGRAFVGRAVTCSFSLSARPQRGRCG